MKIGRQGDGGGRPRTELTPEQIREVETLAAVLNQQQIADYLGIPHRTFQAILERDDDVSASYKRGRARAIGSVSQSLLKSAREGNTTAQIFYLKTQAGWRETAADHAELPPLTINVVDGTPK
jgi:hypothetical protein